jgi:hypothetical protein
VIVQLVVLGAVLVAAGILGTGLTAAGIVIPPIDSLRRQAAIIVFGLVVIVVGVAPSIHINVGKTNQTSVVAAGATTDTTPPPARSNTAPQAAQSTTPDTPSETRETTQPNVPSQQAPTPTNVPPFVRTGIVLPAGSGISFDSDENVGNPIPTASTDIYFQDYAGMPELDAAYSSDPLSPGLPLNYRTCSNAQVFSQGVALFGNLLYDGATICYSNHGVVAAVMVHHVPSMNQSNMYLMVDITVWRGPQT